MPTITAINGVGLRPLDASVPVANVETVVAQGARVTLTGTGFNNPLVNLFTATGFVGPALAAPGLDCDVAPGRRAGQRLDRPGRPFKW